VSGERAGEGWRARLRGDPLPWLLEERDPAVRHLALRQLLDRPADDPEVVAAQGAAMRARPIAAILDHQESDGYWLKPGPGYSPKYRATTWQVIFLGQLGADGSDPRVRAACDYVLANTQATSGGFGASGAARLEPPVPSLVIHCLNGNLLRALIDLGCLADGRLQRAIDWQARAITGVGFGAYYASGTAGPGFRCAMNAGHPCAWGAIKALRGLAAIPVERREPHVVRALEAGADFLLGSDVARADYPTRDGRPPSATWFRLAFPLGYASDVLEDLETLAELGHSIDPRLDDAFNWLLERQDAGGRWQNRSPYRGRMWVEVDRPRTPSKWVTLRACRVLKARAEASVAAPARRG
jgi:hypothetical protein